MDNHFCGDSEKRGVEYEICVVGHLDAHWSDWLEGMQLTQGQGASGAETLLRGSLADEAALHGLLTKLYNLNLVLISVTRLAAGHGSHGQSVNPDTWEGGT
jgi:hypothetical protein